MGMSRRAKKREMQKNIIAGIIVAVFALAVFSINSVGKFIAEKVISPVMNLGKSEHASTDRLSSDGLTFYCVSVLCCDSAKDAEENKSGVTENGGSGYVFVSDGGFYVLYSCFENKDAAQKQCDELKEKYPEAAVTEIKVPSLEIKVTGSSEQITAVKDVFLSLSGAAKTMLSAAGSFEDGALTKLQVCGNISKVSADVQAAKTKLDGIESKNSTVMALKDACLCLETLLKESPESSDGAFLQKLRYVSSAFVCEYVVFCTELG